MAKKDMNDIVGKDYGDYVVLSYENKNSSGNHIYKVRFKDSGNIFTRTRQSVRNGKLKDVKEKKRLTKKKNISARRKKGSKYSKHKEEMLYGRFDIRNNTLVLDQSTKNNGYAIIQDGEIYKYGIIVNNDNNLSLRIYNLLRDIRTIVDKYNIKNIVIENIFLGYDPTVYMKLSMVIGAISVFCVGLGISLMTIPNPTWRSTYGITGGRSFCKTKSLKVAMKILGKKITSNDISDAICIAEHILISRGLHRNTYCIDYSTDTSSIKVDGFDW